MCHENVKCKFGSRKCNSDPKWNNNNCMCECKSSKEQVLLTIQ